MARLKPEETKKLALAATDALYKEKSVQFKASRQQIQDAIYHEIYDHFEVEREIDQKAEQLYQEQSASMGQMDKGKAMGMIRRQLASEKQFILSGGNEGRFSQDKLYHLGHLVGDRLYDDDLCDFPDEDDGPKFFKKFFIEYFGREDQIDEKVRKKIQSLANAPFEGSREWDVLFRKYKEEELRRMGHGT